MPNRILKESICTSEEIDKLSAFQETVFYRLIVNCDDYGRADARPKLLASKLFPLKDIRSAQIEDALRALTSAELVITYTVGGKPFLQMKTWDRHQQVRNKVSRFPSPEDADTCNQLQSIDSNCNQLQSNDSNCPRNPIQSNPNPYPNPNPKRARADALSVFAAFAGEDHDLAVALADFANMRKSIKKPLTDRAAELICDKLAKEFRREDWIAVINQSVVNSWQGLFPLHDDGAAKGTTRKAREQASGVQQHGAPMSPTMRAAVARMLAEEVQDDG